LTKGPSLDCVIIAQSFFFCNPFFEKICPFLPIFRFFTKIDPLSSFFCPFFTICLEGRGYELEGEAPFLKNGGFPLQTTPFSQKLLNKQQRRGTPLNTAYLSFVVQTLSRLNGLVSFLWVTTYVRPDKFVLFLAQHANPCDITIGEKKGQGSPFLAGAIVLSAYSAWNLVRIYCAESFCGGGMGEELFSKSSSPKTASPEREKGAGVPVSCESYCSVSVLCLKFSIDRLCEKFLKGVWGKLFPKSFPHKTASPKTRVPALEKRNAGELLERSSPTKKLIYFTSKKLLSSHSRRYLRE